MDLNIAGIRLDVTEDGYLTDLSQWNEEIATELAKKEGVNYKIVRILNPWIRSEKLIAKPGKTYYIDIPTENFYIFKNLL
mgnify:CR=1 FL=1